MLAVGTFAPHIEIWDMDVLDALEPVAVLGAAGIEAAAAAAEEEEEAPAKKKKKGGGGGGARRRRRRRRRRACTPTR